MRETMARLSVGQKASVLGWETLFACIANVINGLPLAVQGSSRKDKGEPVDLLTPNVLLLGRNNCREPTGRFEMTSEKSKILQNNKNIMEQFFKLLFESWRSLIPRSKKCGKWKAGPDRLDVGDIVLFKKEESALGNEWHFGRVEELIVDRYRKVKICYKNSSEKVFRVTVRSERECVLIKGIDEVDLGTPEHQVVVAGDLLGEKSS